jgi:E3 ubiquitin-protein ligase RNF14
VRLDEIWSDNQGMEVLFLWTSLLKDDILDFLQIKSPLDISNVVHHCHHHRGKRRSRTTSFNQQFPQVEEQTVTPQSTSDILINTDEHHRHISNASDTSESCYDHRAIQDIASQDMLYPALLEYNKTQRDLVFQVTLFTCQVCFCEKLGRLCMKFSGCGHVYCRDCMRGYFEVQIGEGNVLSLTCPYDRCESQAHPGQVR